MRQSFKKKVILYTLFIIFNIYHSLAQNCQGPETCPPGDDCGVNTYYRDADGDGKGNPSVSIQCVNNPSGYVLNNQDCDDTDPNVWNNCCTKKTWYRDVDNDGIGNSNVSKKACNKPAGYVASKGDCNDDDNSIQGPRTWYVDNDGDGQGADMTADYHQGLPTSELDQVTKVGCSKPSGYVANNDDCNDLSASVQQSTWGRDVDGDGFGNSSDTYVGCNAQAGYVTNISDCDDGNSEIRPTTEWYKDVDDDGYSNGTTITQCTRPSGYKLVSELISLNEDCDDGDAEANIAYTWYLDADTDGYGTISDTRSDCRQPEGYVSNFNDCDDNDFDLNPNTTWYEDGDQDGFGNPYGQMRQSCTDPSIQGDSEWVLNNEDCDDTDGTPPPIWYLDNDGDGHAGDLFVIQQCDQPHNGYAQVTDCNDNNPKIFSAVWWYIDNDGDGLGADMSSTRNQSYDPAEFPDPVFSCNLPGGNWVNNNDDCYDPPSGVGGDGMSLLTLHLDADGDGFGDSSITIQSCDPTGNYVVLGGDCNDHPDIDGHLYNPETTWYQDLDADGATNGITQQVCDKPGDTYYLESELIYGIDNIDCDDEDHLLNPGTLWYEDQDEDGYGDPNSRIAQCERPNGYVENDLDNCPLHWGSENGCPSLDLNFVRTTVAKEAGIEIESLELYSKDKIGVSSTFLNGLGNKIQQVNKEYSPLGYDMISPVEYDQKGLMTKEYLPYAAQSKTGKYHPLDLKNHYKSSAQYLFYQTGNDMVTDSKPFSEVIYDKSPLNRVVGSTAAGEVWHNNNKQVIYEYKINEDNEVLQFKTTNNLPALLSFNPTYPAGELTKSIVTDEDGNQTIEFTDKQGHTILKKSQVNDNIWAETYYIYDAYGQLAVVLPPEAVAQLNTGYVEQGVDTKKVFLNTWAFLYDYDERHRMVMKKVPGADSVFMIYDRWDRLILTQDGVQRTTNSWLFTKYDALNRPIITGITTGGSISEERSAIMASTVRFDTLNTGLPHAYSNQSYPTDNIVDVLTVTYYDNYDFMTGTNLEDVEQETPEEFEGIDIGKYRLLPNTNLEVKGLVTGSKTKVLGTDKMIETATFYDNKNRIIQVKSTNHLGGTDEMINHYDFTGQVKRSIGSHTKSDTTYVVTRSFVYDHAGRLLETWHKLESNSDSVLIAKNRYNELGELVEKDLHGGTGDAFAQSIDYAYNIRGWLTRMNEIDLSGEDDDLFGMELLYTDEIDPLLRNDQFYNGNIAAMKWSDPIAAGTDNTRAYTYGYDKLNRLTEAKHFENFTATENHGVEGLDYDLNGNIERLKRYGNRSLDNEEEGDSKGNEKEERENESPKYEEEGGDYESPENENEEGNEGDDSWYEEESEGNEEESPGYDDESNEGIEDDEMIEENENDTPKYMDDLSYHYIGNQLLRVSDEGANSEGFNDGYRGSIDYVYDANGNMVKDRNKGIESIYYNHLNLPTTVILSKSEGSKDSIIYLYDAAGIKLAQHVFEDGKLVKATDYIGEFIYENNKLQLIQHEEGRIIPPDNEVVLHSFDGSDASVFSVYPTQSKSEIVIEGETYIKIKSGISATKTTRAISYIGEKVALDLPAGKVKLRVKGYSEQSSVNMPIAGDGWSVWPGIKLPIGAGNEDWVEISFDVPQKDNMRGRFMLFWSGGVESEAVVYINEIEIVAPTPKSEYDYQYHLKDHLGNVRLTFSTTPEHYTMVETFETGESNGWQDVRRHFNSHANTTDGGNEVGLLHSGETGAMIFLELNKGDTINLSVNANYGSSPEDNTLLVTAYETLFESFDHFYGGGVENGLESSSSAFDDALNGLDMARKSDETFAPKAFLNYIFFDQEMNHVKSGFKQISTAAEGTNAIESLSINNFIPDQEGYILSYLSNENEQPVDVHFDDFTVYHGKTNVVSTQDYYPFGLTFNESVRTASEPQKFLLSGNEKQDDWGVGVYDFNARTYDATIGRFYNVDPFADIREWVTPYNYVQNNPMILVDPLGLFDIFYINNDGSTERVEQEGAHEYYVQNTEGDRGTYHEDYTHIATLEENESGMVEFSSSGDGYGRYGTNDAGGQSTNPAEDVGSGDHFVTPETAAALFGATNALSGEGITIDLGDMSSSNGSDPWQSGFNHHSGHGHNGNRSGLDADFRYVDSNGNSFQSSNAFNSSNFSSANNQTVFNTASTFGFTENYQGTSGSLTGVTQATGHNDHGHLGRANNNSNVTTINRKPRSASFIGPPR